MPRPLFLHLSLWTILFASLPAISQQFKPKSIQFKGDPEHTDQELLDAAGLKKGTLLTAAEMGNHSKLLMDSGIFDNLTYKFDGQDLIFYLTPAEHLYPVKLENLPLTTGPELDSKLHQRLPLYHGKVPSEGTLLDDVRSALEEMLSSEGVQVSITATPSGQAGTRNVNAMSFSINSPPIHASVIQMEGIDAADQAKVKELLAVAAKLPFDTENSAGNLQRVLENFYHDRGYAEAKAKAIRLGNSVPDAGAISVPYSMRVEQGPIYKVGAVQLAPGTPVTQAEVDKILAPQPGGPAESVRFRSLLAFISTRYKSKGYLDCKIDAYPHFDRQAGIVNYTVEIAPGPVYHLGFVKFDNVSAQLRSLLMKSWQMLPGDPFDETYVANFVSNAQKSDPALLKTLTGVQAKFDVMADPQTREVNVAIRFEK